jgi:hypothetical protein
MRPMARTRSVLPLCLKGNAVASGYDLRCIVRCFAPYWAGVGTSRFEALRTCALVSVRGCTHRKEHQDGRAALSGRQDAARSRGRAAR